MNLHRASHRRGFLRSAVAGSLLMPGILHELLAADNADPLAPRAPHFPAKAKSVIFLFMSGGVSHVDSFDPKPKLFADHGKQVTLDHPETRNRPGYEKLFLKRPGWEFTRCGSERDRSEHALPARRGCIDEIALVRSMHTSHSNHYNATLGMHTGSFAFARPSLGAWVSYGLGTENRNLPSFVVIAPQMPYAGTQVWASDFLPGAHQGTRMMPGPEPIANLTRRVATRRRQELELAALAEFNESHRSARRDDPRLAARIKSFETAFGMQMEMPAALDLSQENDATLRPVRSAARQHGGFRVAMPGRPAAGRAGSSIRRADRHRLERGNWDSHGDMADHAKLAKNVDRADRRSAHGLEAARASRRRAGRLDDGVRPHAVQQHGRQQRPRAS